jgi:hypothetical protein
MNKIALIVAVLAYSIFAADTLYLKDGKEIKDASIVEIGINEVKYKVGKKEVLYTVRKSDIAIIFYSDGTRETFANEGSSQSNEKQIIINNNQNQNVNQSTAVATGGQQTQPQDKVAYDNFTTGQRWATWGLNWIVPGVGSLLVMNDWTGAITQWALIGGGIFLFYAGLDTYEECYDSYYSNYCDEMTKPTTISYIGLIAVLGSGVWNIYRSASYDKPHPKTAYGKYEGFNLAVIPNRYGNLMPAVTYNKAF